MHAMVIPQEIISQQMQISIATDRAGPFIKCAGDPRLLGLLSLIFPFGFVGFDIRQFCGEIHACSMRVKIRPSGH